VRGSGAGVLRAAAPLVGLAALLLIAPGMACADEFFPVRDENPLIRGFYLPLPSDSRLTDGQSLSAALSIMNTLNVESRPQESVLVDGESDALRLTYENSLFESWRYRFTVPIIHDSGGFLDSAIDHWHRWFGFNPGNRPFYPKNAIVYSYSGRGHVDITQSQTSVGDISGDIGWYAIDDARRTVSFWGGLEAPTGSVSKLTGDGAWDGATWVHGALRWPKWQLAAELGLAQPFGDEMQALRTRPRSSRASRRPAPSAPCGPCARNSTVRAAALKTATSDCWGRAWS
jgi:Protein of unknown function (DUF3187)